MMTDFLSSPLNCLMLKRGGRGNVQGEREGEVFLRRGCMTSSSISSPNDEEMGRKSGGVLCYGVGK